VKYFSDIALALAFGALILLILGSALMQVAALVYR